MSWGPGNIPFSLIVFQENSVYTYLKNKPKPKNNLACCLKTHISFLCVWSESECHSVLSNSLQPRGLYSPWNSPGQSTGVGCLSLLRGIFPTQGLNPGLLHCRQILYQLSHMGSQGILKWVAYPFSSGSSQPRNRTRVSCIAGGFFTKCLPDCKQELCLIRFQKEDIYKCAFLKWMPKRFFMWYKIDYFKT